MEAGRSGASLEYVNISATMGIIISRGMASLKELEEYYSFEDALNMAEIILVNNYNEYQQAKADR